MIVFFIIYLMLNGDGYFHMELQVIYFFTGLFLVGCLFASVLFSELSSKSKGIFYLTVPASHFEKFLCALFYGLIFFTAVYSGIFYMVDTTVVKVSNNIRYNEWLLQQKLYKATPDVYGFQEDQPFKPAPVVNVFYYEKDSENVTDYVPDEKHKEPNYYWWVWLGFFAAQAIYLLGSVYYGAYSFVKTTICLMVVAAFFYFLFQSIDIAWRYGSETYYTFDHASLYKDTVHYIFRIPKGVLDTELFILKYVFTPLFWFVAILRLKEKQV